VFVNSSHLIEQRELLSSPATLFKTFTRFPAALSDESTNSEPARLISRFMSFFQGFYRPRFLICSLLLMIFHSLNTASVHTNVQRVFQIV
jgi:hypothetical protein